MKKDKKEMSEPVAMRFEKPDFKVLEERAQSVGLKPGLYLRTLVVPLLRKKEA